MLEGMLSTYDLQGAPVFDRSGWEFSVFKGLLFNMGSGRVHYAIVSSDGFLGMGSDCRPLPIWLLEQNEDRLGFTAKVNAEWVAEAPCYTDQGHFDDQAGFWTKVARHYGHEPSTSREGSKPALSLIRKANTAIGR